MLSYKNALIRKASSGKRLLDIGTGTGYFIKYMSKRGYQVSGVEVSRTAGKFCRSSFGLEDHPPDNLHDSTKLEEFDLVSFWHVLEHIYDPDRVLTRVHELLHKDGRAIIALPNYRCLDAYYYKSFWAVYDVPRHLWYFTPSSLDTYAQKFGFTLEKKKFLPLDPFYNAMLSAQYLGNLSSKLIVPFIGIFSFLKGWFFTDSASLIISILKKV